MADLGSAAELGLNTGLNLLSFGYGRKKAKSAAKAQAIANAQAQGKISEGYDSAVNQQRQSGNVLSQYLSGAREELQPYADFGKQGLNQLNYYTSSPDKLDALVKADPGYQFRLKEGQKALDRGAAASGMSLSGAQQKALGQYNQDYATNAFNDAYGRLMQRVGIGSQMGGQLYQSRAGEGQALAGIEQDIGQLGIDKANALANLILGRGDVEANKHRALSDLAMGASQNQMKVFGDYFGGKEDKGGSSGFTGGLPLNLLAAFLGG